MHCMYKYTSTYIDGTTMGNAADYGEDLMESKARAQQAV